METLDLSDDPLHSHAFTHTRTCKQWPRSSGIGPLFTSWTSSVCSSARRGQSKCLCEALSVWVWPADDLFQSSSGPGLLLLSALHKSSQQTKHICQLRLMYFRGRNPVVLEWWRWNMLRSQSSNCLNTQRWAQVCPGCARPSSWFVWGKTEFERTFYGLQLLAWGSKGRK